ncbi:MAG: hypothetical protein E6R14_05380 [Thermomicrobiales bacterium]|nr:MAG: hypothetical protein E6R14_05380 [Thermomicrobiales bacterium]
MIARAIHTSDIHHADRLWVVLGGRIEDVRRTGERRYEHPHFDRPLRINGRRHDVPAKLLSRINQLLKLESANDPAWTAAGDWPRHSKPPAAPDPGTGHRPKNRPIARATSKRT